MPDKDWNDWKLKQLEEEIRHEQAMRLLQTQRLDTHDASIATIYATLEVVGSRLDQVAGLLTNLTIAQAKTDATLQDLIRAIASEHSNGKG